MKQFARCWIGLCLFFVLAGDVARTGEAKKTVETRIGLGCLILPEDYRVVTTGVLSDATSGYVEQSGQTWRIEWCSGMCGFPGSGELATANPEALTYFWVDSNYPESIDYLPDVTSAFSLREEPWLCSCTADETDDGSDWVRRGCI